MSAPHPLLALLQRRIALHGPLTVAQFMAEALLHPRYGYYTGADPLGAAGDFTTAPEISQMFGELIGLWCADTWERLGRPAPLALVELGPGRGTLMADALRASRMLPAFRDALSVHLVEASPLLRQRQAATLGSSGLTPTWHDHLDSLPELPLLVIANEFFDALPIRQFERTAEGWCERLVDLAPPDFAAPQEPPPEGPPPALRFVRERRPGAAGRLVSPALKDAPVGALAEVCPAGVSLMGALADRLCRHGGAALVIDYGYRGPALGDTLQAVRRHAYAPVLVDPGTADLTAHVDFGALAEAATAAGAHCFGPVSQGQFLTRLGIEARAATLRRRASPAQAREIDQALRRLRDEAEMGQLFQALAVTFPEIGCPAGFVDGHTG